MWYNYVLKYSPNAIKPESQWKCSLGRECWVMFWNEMQHRWKLIGKYKASFETTRTRICECYAKFRDFISINKNIKEFKVSSFFSSIACVKLFFAYKLLQAWKSQNIFPVWVYNSILTVQNMNRWKTNYFSVSINNSEHTQIFPSKSDPITKNRSKDRDSEVPVPREKEWWKSRWVGFANFGYTSAFWSDVKMWDSSL